MDKKILIPAWSLGENSFGATKAYVEYLSQYGTVLIGAPTAEIIEGIDLVILPGGADTYSFRYNEVPSVKNSSPDLFKEFFLDNNLPLYLERGVPVFGICLGMQMLQVHFGGSLVQNVDHPYSSSNWRAQLVHGASLTPEFDYLYKKLSIKPPKTDDKGNEIGFKVNSLHHQGVALSELAEGLKAVLLSTIEDEDPIVEAFVHTTLPIAGYQGHPEETNCPVADYLISSLLEKSPNYNTKKIEENVQN